MPIPPAGGDLLQNSNFESDISGWSAFSSVLAHVPGGDSPVGNGYVAQVTRAPGQGTAPSSGLPSGAYGIDSAGVPARAGYAYTASALVRGSEATSLQPIRIFVRERNSGGTVVATWPSAVYNMSSDAYTRITATYVALHSGDTIDTYIARSLYQGYDGFQAGAAEAFNVAGYTLTAAAPAYVPSTNLTQNPSFELQSTGTRGWQASGGALARTQDGGAPDGNYAAQVTANGTGPVGLASTSSITATAGASYTATAWIRAGNSTASGQRVQLSLTESAGGGTAGQTTSAPITLGTSGYGELTVTLTAPAAGALTFAVSTTGAPGTGARILADALTLTSTPPCNSRWGSFGAGNWPTACWRPYSDSSFINTPVAPSAPTVPSSGALVSNLLNGAALSDPSDAYAFGWGQYPMSIVPSSQPDPSHPDGYVDPLSDQGSHPTFWSTPNDPTFTISCTEPWGPNGTSECPLSDATADHPVHVPASAIPAGYFSSSSFDHDAHMTVIDQANNIEYDMWGVKSITPGNPGHIVVSWGGYTSVIGAGAAGIANTAQADAGNVGLLAGVIRAQELQAGQINHALFMDVPCVGGAPDDAGGANVVPPMAGYGVADHICSQLSTLGDSSQASKLSHAYTHPVPMGTHFRLDMSVGQIENLPASQYPTWEKAILKALSVYGGYVADSSDELGQWGFQVEGGTTYTSFNDPATGRPYVDPMYTLARNMGLTLHNYQGNYCPSDGGASPFQQNSCGSQGTPDDYSLNFDNVDWSRLEVLQPAN